MVAMCYAPYSTSHPGPTTRNVTQAPLAAPATPGIERAATAAARETGPPWLSPTYPRGRPSPRVAMMLRWISEDPPPIVPITACTLDCVKTEFCGECSESGSHTFE